MQDGHQIALKKWRAGGGYCGSAVRVVSLVLIIGCLLCGRVQANEARYSIHQGDRIALTIAGVPDQSGEYAVNIDGTLTHPLAGNVAAVGRTVAELHTDLAERLGKYLPSPTLAVSIATYAPVFVVGDVEKSGEYAFRPGMTALQLLAVAGGPRQDFLPERDGALAIIAAERDYADLSLRIFGSKVAMQRLRAEIAAGEFVADVPRPAAVRPPDAAFIIENERRLFQLRREARLAEDRGLEAQGESYDSEIKFLEQSIALHNEELDLLAQDVTAAQQLVERGISTPARLRDVQRAQSATRRDSLDLQAALARARQGRLNVAQRRSDAAAAFRSAAGNSLQQTEIENASLTLALEAVVKTLGSYAGLSDQSRIAARPAELELSVLRKGEDGLVERVVTENVLLEPGDVLRAKRPPVSDLNPPTPVRRQSMSISP